MASVSIKQSGAMPWAYRMQVLSRVVCALGGGYVLSAAFAAATGLVLVQWAGMSKVDAVTVATMLSFVVFAVIVLWVFACASTRRAWVGTTGVSLVLCALVLAMYQGQV